MGEVIGGAGVGMGRAAMGVATMGAMGTTEGADKEEGGGRVGGRLGAPTSSLSTGFWEFREARLLARAR